MKIFNRKFIDYLKPCWPYLLAVSLIGQLQLVGAFLIPQELGKIIAVRYFLQITQALWALIIGLSILRMVKKFNFTFLQTLFLGFLYIIVFGGLKVFVRAVFLGHDVHYLFLGDERNMAPMLECILYISLITVVSGAAGILDKKYDRSKSEEN